MDAATRLNPARFPLWTLLVCAIAGAVYGSPPLQALLIYDRAAIDDGELWRLVTGNFVHHSASHFIQDVVPLLIAGTLMEIQRLRYSAGLYLASAALIGGALYLGKPEIIVFGGLSGMVTAAVTFLCLHGLDETGAWRWLCLAVLACLVAKIGAEMALGSSFLFTAEPQNFVPVPESHVVGAASALLLYLRTKHTGCHHLGARRQRHAGRVD